MLRWIGRFRVVDSEVLSMRFGVTEQRINARVRRLLQAGLLGTMAGPICLRRRVYVTGRGARKLGLPVRRPPGADFDVGQELLLARLTAMLETRHPAVRVLSQREARSAERFTDRPHSVHGRHRRRFPDLLLAAGTQMTALVLVLRFKPKKHLEELLTDFHYSDTFDEVVWLVSHRRDRARLDERVRLLGPTWKDKQPTMSVLTYDWQQERRLADELASKTARQLAPAGGFTKEEHGSGDYDWEALLGNAGPRGRTEQGAEGRGTVRL